MGCDLWLLYNPNVEDLCVAWRRSMRKIWQCFQQAHCFLLHSMSGSLPVFDVLCRWSMSFVRSCISLDSYLIRFVANFTLPFLLSLYLPRLSQDWYLRYWTSFVDSVNVFKRRLKCHFVYCCFWKPTSHGDRPASLYNCLWWITTPKIKYIVVQCIVWYCPQLSQSSKTRRRCFQYLCASG